MSNQRSDTDRRSIVDRRQIYYTAHVPERRSGTDRRSGSDRRTGIERRKDRRLLTKDPTFVTLWTEHTKEFAEKDGQLLDISKGGIALRCTATPEESKDYSLLEIFQPGYDNNIDNIPFKLISDIEMISDSALSELTLRRYGVQFDQLTSKQTAMLDYFLLNHTVLGVNRRE